ncbi:MAG: endonuclease/exonuclease/phosphatase family protein [Clostridia bacterium]|nr:endonuclease/exonuclease/phosphatase family protein [Clostridia bacterium]
MLKVMTFNLRTDSEIDGINRFFLRSDRVLEAIRNEDPDVIGFQEAAGPMREFLYKNLNDYTIIGCGSNALFQREGNPIAYKKGKLELIGFETAWLSDTPDIPGSSFGGDQSKYPRCYHLARLRVLDSDTTVVYINTHTDHLGQNAREKASRLLLEVLKKEKQQPLILSGDLNASPDSAEIQLLLSEESLGLSDATANIPGTFHNYGRRIPTFKCDYIFSTLSCIESHIVEDIPVNGVYISDHNPVVATLEI